MFFEVEPRQSNAGPHTLAAFVASKALVTGVTFLSYLLSGKPEGSAWTPHFLPMKVVESGPVCAPLYSSFRLLP